MLHCKKVERCPCSKKSTPAIETFWLQATTIVLAQALQSYYRKFGLRSVVEQPVLIEVLREGVLALDRAAERTAALEAPLPELVAALLGRPGARLPSQVADVELVTRGDGALCPQLDYASPA